MKKLLLLFLMTLLVVSGCSHYEQDVLTNSNNTPDGTLDPVNFVLYATTQSSGFYTAPEGSEPEHIYLTVLSVQLRKAEDSLDWITVAEPNAVFDFLDLVDGVTAELASTNVEPGRYTMLRLILAESNEIVFDGTSNELFVPSGTNTGVKLSANLTIEGGETLTGTIIFDAATSIVSTEQNYLLRPSFRLVIDSE